MAGRAIWKGQLHFGLINIPVKLHTAVKEEPIQYQLDDGRYVLVTPEELEETLPEESRTIEIIEFVKASQIDPLFIARGYYLEPDGQPGTYRSLAAVLSDMKMEGICLWTMRKRSYIGALQWSGKVLRLNTLRYADEIIPASSLDLPHVSLSEKELQIGVDLIDHLTSSFEPQKYRNDHEIKLQQLIDKKARGEKIAILRPRRLKPTPSDKLMQALEASLKKVA